LRLTTVALQVSGETTVNLATHDVRAIDFVLENALSSTKVNGTGVYFGCGSWGVCIMQDPEELQSTLSRKQRMLAHLHRIQNNAVTSKLTDTSPLRSKPGRFFL
jgi:N-acetylmuramic acid 6-phosphate (MurNAc-6-P) etherase